MKVPLDIGLIIACAAALLAALLLIARGIIRKRRVRRLTREEKKLLEYAYKSQGMIHHIESDRIPGGWIRAGGSDFNADPERAARYREALKRLLVLGHVAHQSGNLYLLTLSGWKHAGKRLVF
jgi:hypothetical protein